MNRLTSTMFVALTPLLLFAVVYTTTASAVKPDPEPVATSTISSSPTPSVKGSVVWGERVVLARDATVSVRLVDVSSSDGVEVVLGEQVINLTGRPFPAKFEIAYDPASIRPSGLYVVVGDVVAGGSLVYQSMTRTPVITQGSPAEVRLVLYKIGPWSPFDVAVSSGQLARFSY